MIYKGVQMEYLFKGNCTDILYSQNIQNIIKNYENAIIVTDPPFNIGYKYNTYKDNKTEEKYYSWLSEIVQNYPCILIHYPENLYKFAFEIGRFPTKIVSWVYNGHCAKQHRDIAFFDVKPIFEQVRQPYKNPNDKRIKAKIANGSTGGRLYDWWNIQQVKNVSKEKTEHPCQMPQEVMNNIIGILPRDKNTVVIDPFMGSGTTGVACRKYNIDFIGIEIDDKYFKIAENRIVR